MKSPQLPLDDVESRLKDEARGLRARTNFSPLLHQRIMASLHDSKLPFDAAQPPRRAPLFWRIAMPTGVAALIALGTWIALRPSHVADISVPKVAKTPDSAPSISLPQLPPTSTDIASNALDRGKFAYLDRDADRLLTFVADQIPSFPQKK